MECSPLETPNPVLRIGQPSITQSDRHFYTFANLNITTQGASAAYPGAAELWVTYDIDFFKPILTNATNNGVYRLRCNSASVAAPFGGNITPSINELGIITSLPNVLTFPWQMPLFSSYLISYTIAGASTPLVTSIWNLVLAGGMQAKQFFQNQTIPYINCPSSALTTDRSSLTFIVTYTGGGTPAIPPTVTFPTSGWVAPTSAGADLLVIAVPYTMVNRLTSPSAEPEFDDCKDSRRR